MTGKSAIPADWEVHTLDDVSVKIQDGTHFSPTLGGAEYRYITSRNIGSGRLRLDSVEMISESEHRKIYRRCDTRCGDLLLTKDGANTGNAAINSFTDEISLLSSVAFVRANHRLATEGYLLQYLLSGPGRKQIEDAMAGNAITRLTLAKIRSLRVPMPRVEEQQRIAAALGDTDDLIASLERIVAKKQAIKQGMMQQLLTGNTRLPGFAVPWRNVLLGDHVTYVRTVALSRAQLDNQSPVRYLHYGDIHTRSGAKLDAANEPMPRANAALLGNAGRLQVGDVVFADASEDPDGVGRSVEITAVPSAGIVPGLHTIAARFNQDVLANGFKAYLQFIPAFRQALLRLAAGTKVLATTRSFISSVTVYLPDVDEQHAIAVVLDDVDAEIAQLEARLAKARDMKLGMMQELLTGRTRLPVAEGAV